MRASLGLRDRIVAQWRWLLAAFGIGLLLSLGIHALSWVILPSENDRPPQRVELVIPPGTAQRVAAGEAVPSIPANFIFVVGDTLVIRNEDVVDHQIGPFWVPAGTSVSDYLDRPSTLSYFCTIHPSRYIGLEVWPRASLWAQLPTVVILGVSLGVLINFFIIAHISDQAETGPDSLRSVNFHLTRGEKI